MKTLIILVIFSTFKCQFVIASMEGENLAGWLQNLTTRIFTDILSQTEDANPIDISICVNQILRKYLKNDCN